MNYTLEDIMTQAYPVMPVLAVERVEDAIPLAQALKAGGLNVLEVTLRTANAMAVIEAMKTVAGVIVGAGTVTRVEQLHELVRIGADFAISPGATPALLAEGKRVELPFLPAIATVSEMMQGLELGYEHFKFFPAEAAGGTAALKSFAGPFPFFFGAGFSSAGAFAAASPSAPCGLSLFLWWFLLVLLFFWCLQSCH